MNSMLRISLGVFLVSVSSTFLFANGSSDSPMGQKTNGFYGHGRGMGMHGGGWDMNQNGGDQSSSVVPDGERLQMEQVNSILVSAVGRNGDDGWGVMEIMEFESNFYAQIGDIESGRLITEVLVDPYTGYVQPEFGPNMMWNTEVGGHGGGGMMGWGYRASGDQTRVSEDEAIEIANKWLKGRDRDWVADDHADQFPGYYTIHTLNDGEITGMLSVNGRNGSVWYHEWHGEFLGMDESSGEDVHS